MSARHSSIRPALTLLALLLALPHGEAQAQEAVRSDTTPLAVTPRPVAAAVVGGCLGSAVGVAGGIGIGYLAARCVSGEKECHGRGAELGAFVGSITGAALGAKLLAERGGASPSLRSTLLAAAGGIFAGGISSALVRSISDHPISGLVSFSVGQGVFTGVWAATR